MGPVQYKWYGGAGRPGGHLRGAGAGCCSGGAAPLRPASGRANAGAGRRGGASAGPPRGFTCSSERAEQRRGRLRGRRTHRPEGARRRPDLASLPEPGGGRSGAAWLEARGPLERRRRRSERRDRGGGRERAPDPGHRAGARARRGGEDDRGLRRVSSAALALRRAPGKLPSPSRQLGSPSSAGPPPEPAGRALAQRGSPGLPRPAPGAPAACSRLPRSTKPPAMGRSAEPLEQQGAAVWSGVWVWVWVCGGRGSSAPGGTCEASLSRPRSLATAWSSARPRWGSLPAGGAGAPSIVRWPRSSELVSPARAGAAEEGSWQQWAGHQGAGDCQSGRPCWGLGTRGAAPPRTWSSECWRGPQMRMGSGGGPPGTLAADSPRRRLQPVSGGAAAARSARQELGEMQPGARSRRPPSFCGAPRALPQPCSAPAGCRALGLRAGCAGGRRGGKQRGRESRRNPLSWPIGLAAPPGLSSCNLGNKQVRRPEAGSEAAGRSGALGPRPGGWKLSWAT